MNFKNKYTTDKTKEPDKEEVSADAMMIAELLTELIRKNG